MFIQTEALADSAALKFLPGQPVLPSGTAHFPDAESSAGSPLAQRIFEVGGVTSVFLDPQSITVKKRDDTDWKTLKPVILGIIMEHFTAGRPAVVAEQGTDVLDDAGEDSEIAAKIKDLIDTRIRPAAAQDGGDVIYRGFKDGVVLLEMIGSGAGLKDGIENMLRHYVPEVAGVSDYRDALPKPGLETPEGKLIQALLDERVNPAVASHGGHISLVDVQDDTVLETAVDDVAAVLGRRRADAGVDQVLDLGRCLAVFAGIVGDVRRLCLDNGRSAGGEMLHDDAEDERLQGLPVRIVPFLDGDGLWIQEHAGDAFDLEDALGQG